MTAESASVGAGVGAGGQPRISPKLLLGLQLAAQYFFMLALWVWHPVQSLRGVAVAYATAVALQLILKRLRPGTPLRLWTWIATCNTVLLFYAASGFALAVPVAVAWAARTFLVGREGRPLANPGTVGILVAGALSSYLEGGFGIVPISHGLTTIPHFQLVVCVLGATMAVLGDHLALVLALLAGFAAVRGFPNAAELLVFLFAAPDPASSPRRTGERVAAGLSAGALTGLFWRLNGRGNELTKVSGLIVVATLMPLLRRLPAWPPLRRALDAIDRAAPRSLGPALAGAALIAAFGLASDLGMGAKRYDVWAAVEDARTHQALGEKELQALAGDLHASYPGTELTVFWSRLNHNWDVFSAKPAPGRPTDAPITVAFRLACDPQRAIVDPRLIHARVEPVNPEHLAVGKETFMLTLEVDGEEISRRCRK